MSDTRLRHHIAGSAWQLLGWLAALALYSSEYEIAVSSCAERRVPDQRSSKLPVCYRNGYSPAPASSNRRGLGVCVPAKAAARAAAGFCAEAAPALPAKAMPVADSAAVPIACLRVKLLMLISSDCKDKNHAAQRGGHPHVQTVVSPVFAAIAQRPPAPASGQNRPCAPARQRASSCRAPSGTPAALHPAHW